jgi:hydrogenase expression/formation protein HypD
MEVCGGQTHSLLRHGIQEQLRDAVELIHGPGCPVCVTPAQAIDFAQVLAMQPDTVLVSFGDMLRVPGTQRSLQDIRTGGGNVRTVYSPLDAVELARRNPHQHFVFFAVGFETTAPATALAVLQAHQLKLDNFSLLVSHVRVQPAMESILQSPSNRVQAFLAAGHVCAVAGFDSYHAMAQRFSTPIVVTGFEPIDLLEGILACISQLEAGQHKVQNRYVRSVSGNGNPDALNVIEQVYQINDAHWRGLGVVEQGGLVLQPQWKQYDASHRFADLQPPQPTLFPHQSPLTIVDQEQECRAAEVLSGRLRPDDCPAFGNSCRPDSPLGAPMVSSEGACAAYYRFGRVAAHRSTAAIDP